MYKRSGGWAYRVDIGLDAETGKRRQALPGAGTNRDAEKALDEVIHSAETGSVVSRSTMHLSEFLDNWVAGQSEHLRETTQHSRDMVPLRALAVGSRSIGRPQHSEGRVTKQRTPPCAPHRKASR